MPLKMVAIKHKDTKLQASRTYFNYNKRNGKVIINLLPDKLHEDCTEFQFGSGREAFQCRAPLQTIDIRKFSPSGWNVLQFLRQRIQILK
jgi:hypothetical protein